MTRALTKAYQIQRLAKYEHGPAWNLYGEAVILWQYAGLCAYYTSLA
jgi:hypothetical protein